MSSAEDSRPLVYVADDEEAILETLTILFGRRREFRVRTFSSAAELIDRLGDARPDVVLADVAMEGEESGLDVLRAVRRAWPDVPVILMSAVASREAVIRAVNEGADYFLQKPFENRDILARVREAHAASSKRTRARVEAARPSRRSRSRRHNHPEDMRRRRLQEQARQVIGEAPAFREALSLVEQAARTDITVLLEGESGVGKEVFARHLHRCSERSEEPFLSVNCGALTETLLESQLFGHLKGAFTGADDDATGLARAAGEGTLFLDEVSEMSPSTQVKLLRVLQEREVIPVGGTEAHPVHARFVAATNQTLATCVRGGRFREDLFWRLNVMPIRIPPLRERAEDIPLLAHHILEVIRLRDDTIRAEEIAEEALEALRRHSWPGNIRELENALHRAAVIAGPKIRPADLPDSVTEESLGASAPLGAKEPAGLAGEAPPTLREVERAYVHWILTRFQGDRARAAAALDLSEADISHYEALISRSLSE